MNKPPDESPPLSSAALLAEINDKLDRTLSTAAQASLQAARTVRIVNANMQLDARNRMALVDSVDQFRRNVQRLGQIVEQLSGGRPPTLTVVQDPPPATAREDITGVFVLNRRVPSLYVKWGVLVLCAIMILVGMGLMKVGIKPSDVAKAAAPLVTP